MTDVNLKILLTGASGFLGSALARHLQKLGHRIALLLRPTSQLDRLKGSANLFDIVRCSSTEEIKSYLHQIQPEVVIHTACAYGRQGESVFDLIDTNIKFGLSLIQSLLIMDRPATFINIGTVLDPQVSTYAMTKHQFSDLGRIIAKQYEDKLRFVNVLLQHMYGPGDDLSKFTSNVIHACHMNLTELRLTKGEQIRDFVYIDDVVSALTLIINNRQNLGMISDVEIGSGVAITIREFVETVHRLTNSHTNLLFGAVPYRAHEPMLCQANLSTIKALGWSPSFDLQTGLKQTIKLESFQ